jgi:hypothetical protein
MPQPAVGLSAAFSKNLLLQYFSKHPTGVPLYIEDWASTRAWSVGETGGGSGGAEVVNGYGTFGPGIFNGVSMLKLTSPGVSEGLTRISRPQGIPPNLRVGIETNFAIPFNLLAEIQTYMRTFEFGLTYYDGTSRYEAVARYNAAADTLEVTDLVNSYVQQANMRSRFRTLQHWLIWHNIKLVADFTTKKFVKLYFNEMEFDISNIPITANLANVERWFMPHITIRDLLVANQFSVYVGNTFLTMEEP